MPTVRQRLPIAAGALHNRGREDIIDADAVNRALGIPPGKAVGG
jgi:hypothetical protein